jgi:hypothetical protein
VSLPENGLILPLFCHWVFVERRQRYWIKNEFQESPFGRQTRPPRAIPVELEPVILDLYRRGYGYRAIARILRTEFSVNPDFSTVRRTLQRLGMPPHRASSSKR